MLAVLPPAPPEPVTEAGLALSFTDCARLEVGVVTCVVGAVEAAVVGVTIEFFRVFGPEIVVCEPIFLEARVAAPPEATGRDAPEPRLRFLITSVFRESGRTTP